MRTQVLHLAAIMTAVAAVTWTIRFKSYLRLEIPVACCLPRWASRVHAHVPVLQPHTTFNLKFKCFAACGDNWGPEDAGAECELQAKYDITALQKSYTWAPLQLIPQMEVADYSDDDYDASPLQAYSGAVAWAQLARTMGWYISDNTWQMQYWTPPTLKINLATLRDGEYSVRYWGGTLLHELLHQMGHNHLEGPGPNFVYGADECLEFEGDASAVNDFRRTGIR